MPNKITYTALILENGIVQELTCGVTDDREG
jgi:hypothetical protein